MRGLKPAALAVLLLCACSSTPPGSQDSGTPCDAGLCGTACVDVRVDSQHCGACDVACATTDACAGGRCYPKACGADPCAEWQVCVTGFCVDRECFGVVCPTDQLCARGACLPTTCSGMTCGPQQVCFENRCAETACVGVQCPTGAICRAGVCAIDTCSDSAKDGDETDIDCGGSCPGCGVGSTCDKGADCVTRSCSNGVCRAATCSDGIRNQGEGDADCAGPCPALCAEGKTCAMNAQCQSGACSMGRCTTASCSDSAKNGTESDIDCGGTCSTTCPDGKHCNSGPDCSSTLCQQTRCVPLTCQNMSKDGTESDIDCGGSCSPCPAGRACGATQDCVSLICTAMRCAATTCSDTVKNGTESDVDCGGSCTACATGKKCGTGTDCASRSCAAGVCAAATCMDGIANAAETDVDCGGTTCPRCSTGKFCALPTDCLTSNCGMGRCQATVILGAAATYQFGTRGADNFWDLAVADLDSDGRPDVMGSFRPENGDGWLQVFYGQSDGGLTALGTDAYQVPIPSGSSYSQSYGVTIADLDGDGKLDLVAARSRFSGAFYNPDYCIIDWFRGAGPRMFFPMNEVVTAQSSAMSSGCGNRLVSGRFNADALPDLFATDTFAPLGGLNGAGDVKGGYLAFAFDGGVSMPVLLPLSGHQAAVPIDIDKNGLLDLVTASNRSTKVNIFLNNPAGTFTLANSFTAAGDADLAVADLDGDGLYDIAYASTSGNNVSVARATSATSFLAPSAYPVPRARGVAIVDMDGDGKLDLVVGGTGVAVLKGNGDGTFLPPTTYSASLGDLGPLRIGDFNLDGKPDVVTATMSNGKVLLLLNIVP